MNRYLIAMLFAAFISGSCSDNSTTIKENVDESSKGEEIISQLSVYENSELDELETSLEYDTIDASSLEISNDKSGIIDEGEEVKSIANFDYNYLEDRCKSAFIPVYQKLSIKTDKEHLEKLHNLYESSSKQELDSKRSSGLGINLPEYGSLSWNENKAKVKRIYETYKSSSDFTLSTSEHLDLFSLYSREADVQKSLDVWLQCIAITSDIPFLELDFQDSSTLIVRFRMKPNDFVSSNTKVKVKDINYPSNLQLLKGDLTGKKIKYKGEYTLIFKRKDLKEAFISIDLETGNILPLSVPAIEKKIVGPVLETKYLQDTYVIKMSVDLAKGLIKLTHPNGNSQEVTFTPNAGPSKRIISTRGGSVSGNMSAENLERYMRINPDLRRDYAIINVPADISMRTLDFNVKTTLSNKDARIEDYFYRPITGGLGDFQKRGIKIENDGTLSLDSHLLSGAMQMAGDFTIIYGVTKEVCVKNCPL